MGIEQKNNNSYNTECVRAKLIVGMCIVDFFHILNVCRSLDVICIV